MKIVIAPDSFKESLTALEAANAIEEGFKKVFPDAEYLKVPMADGGEGTLHALLRADQFEGRAGDARHPVSLPVVRKRQVAVVGKPDIQLVVDAVRVVDSEIRSRGEFKFIGSCFSRHGMNSLMVMSR